MFKYSFSISFTFFVCQLSAQTEVGFYGSFLDYPGIYIEHRFDNDLEINLSGSFRYKTGDILFADAPNKDIRTNTFIGLAVKNNFDSEFVFGNWFAGAYLRYWRKTWEVSSTDNLTIAQQQNVDTLALTISREYHKISVGALGGYKFILGQHFTLSITVGLGFSPKFAYRKTIEEYNRNTHSHQFGSDDFIGYFNHLSGIGRLSIGCKF